MRSFPAVVKEERKSFPEWAAPSSVAQKGGDAREQLLVFAYPPPLLAGESICSAAALLHWSTLTAEPSFFSLLNRVKTSGSPESFQAFSTVLGPLRHQATWFSPLQYTYGHFELPS